MHPTKFQNNWLLGLGDLGFLISRILAIFDLQVTLILLTKFGVNWPFGSGKEVQIGFLRWQPSWISNRNDFSYFWSTSHPDASCQVSSQFAQGRRWSRLLKQLLTLQTGRRTTDDRHWLTTIAHHEHFVLRWAKNLSKFGSVIQRRSRLKFSTIFPYKCYGAHTNA